MSDFSKGFLLGGWLSSDDGDGSDNGCLAILWMILMGFVLCILLFTFGVIFAANDYMVEQGIWTSMNETWHTVKRHSIWNWIGILFIGGLWDLYLFPNINPEFKWILLPLVSTVVMKYSHLIVELVDDAWSNNSLIYFFQQVIYFPVALLLGLTYIGLPIIIARTIYYIFIAIF